MCAGFLGESNDEVARSIAAPAVEANGVRDEAADRTRSSAARRSGRGLFAARDANCAAIAAQRRQIATVATAPVHPAPSRSLVICVHTR